MRRSRDRTAAIVCALIVLLALGTVYDQFWDLKSLSPDPYAFVRVNQKARNDGILRGEGGDPWQYRVGSEWLARQALRVAGKVGFDDPAVVGFLAFRVLQNLGIFALAWLLYRRLGLGPPAAAVGLVLVAYAMTQAHYHSGLAFDTYGDVLVYLAGALLILAGRFEWVVPLVVAGAVSRETCGLLPVMLLATGLRLGVRGEGRRAAVFGAVALAAFGLTVVAVRVVVGPGDLIHPFGRDYGWDLLDYNLTRHETWDNLFRTLTVVPLLAVWRYRAWPPALRTFALALVPAWMAVHLFAAVLDETRLLLVPYVVVLVPGALMGLNRASEAGPRRSAVESA